MTINARKLLDQWHKEQREIELQQGCPRAIAGIDRSMEREALENYPQVLELLIAAEDRIAVLEEEKLDMARSDWGTHGAVG